MTKLTERRIARMLAARATPAPPAGLADRIKAEIPGSIRLDRRTFRPGRRWLLPPLVEGLHPSWLAAASVLLVAGVGMVAARIIPSQPDDVWKWMALSGVVHIDDVVVTAPAPPAPARTAAAAPPRASSGVRVPVPAHKGIAAASRDAEDADEPAVAAEVAANAPAAAEPVAVAMGAAPPAGASGVPASGGREPVADTTVTTAPAAPEPNARASANAAAVGRPSGGEALGRSAWAENALTVVVRDETGRPCEGVTVTLERLGQGAFRTRSARTDSGGAVTFWGVPPASYRALAAAPAITPAQAIVSVVSERSAMRAELHVHTRPRP